MTRKALISMSLAAGLLSSAAQIIAAPGATVGEVATGEKPAPASGVADKAKGFSFDGLVRFRGELKANYQFVDHDNDADWISSKAWLGTHYHWSKLDYTRVLFQYAGIWGGQEGSTTGLTTSDDVSPNGDSIGAQGKVDVREAYINTGEGNHQLRMGRQIISFADQRLVGRLDWSNIGRSHDAVRYIHSVSNKNYLHVWWSIASETNSSDLENNSVNNDPKKDERATMFSGVYDHFRLSPGTLHLEPYFLNIISFKNSKGNQSNLMVPGLRITNKSLIKNDKPEKANYDYAIEGAYQAGDPGTAKNSISAYAGAASAGYYLGVGSMKIRIGGEFVLASGDDSPGDKTIGTFQNLYHTNHAHYGQADFISWQNILAYSGNVKFIWKKSWLNVAYWNLNLMTAKDAWYTLAGNLASTDSTPLKSGETNLVHEFDVTYQYRFAILTLETGASAALAGSAIKKDNGLIPIFTYLMATSKF